MRTLCYHTASRNGDPRLNKDVFMNLYEQLLTVRDRLEGIGAHDDSMDLVEKLLTKAEPAKNDKTGITQVQVLRLYATHARGD